MPIRFTYLTTLLAALPLMASADPVILQGDAATVTVQTGGGAITEFRLTGSEHNPLDVDWRAATDKQGLDMAIPFRGHFVCFDRFGWPSQAEMDNGMPFHGEAAQAEWQVLAEPARSDSGIHTSMRCELPMARMSLERSMRLHPQASVFTVSETIRNDGPLGRIYTQVQHANVGTPFLDDSAILDCNATNGFLYEDPLPDAPQALTWPHVTIGGQERDLRFSTAPDPVPTFLSFADDADLAWVTASMPAKGQLIGYAWDPADYPWLFVYHLEPDYLAFEMSTGLAGPYPTIATRGRILDRPVIAFADAGQRIERSYTAFLTPIPADFAGVESVTVADGRVVIQPRDGGAPIHLEHPGMP